MADQARRSWARAVLIASVAGLLVVELTALGLAVGNLLTAPAHAAGATSVIRTFQAPTTTDAAFRDSYITSRPDTGQNGTAITMLVKPTSSASCPTTGNAARSCDRAFAWFDLSTLPAGSTVSAASVDLNATAAGSASRTHGLHKVTASWTETGITWATRDGSTAWTTAGGDHIAGASQTLATGTGTGVKTFLDVTTLRTDVSGWIDNSANNFGWLVKDQTETSTTEATWTYGAKDNTTLGNRPKLSVTFTAAWDSYNDSGRTVQDDLFQTGENTVFMRGTGYNLVGSYVVGYYDGAGDKRCTEVIAAAAGTLDSSCAFLGAAAAGTWHAVAFEPGITAPATYATINADTHKVVGDDTFTVQSSAITPELPSIIAAVVVGLASIATFWWFVRASRGRQAA